MEMGLMMMIGLMVTGTAILASAVQDQSKFSPWVHNECMQPLVDGNNISFTSAASFATGGLPSLLLAYGSLPNGTHVTTMLGLDVEFNRVKGAATCHWVETSAQLSMARTSGCAVRYGSNLVFAGGHNNSAAYVGEVDVFTRSSEGQVVRTESLMLPIGRELLGCATNGNLTVFAGGKPPHPPAPFGETKEIDIWNHTTNTWSMANLSVERKKVEAVSVGDEILMAGGEIGHHPPIKKGIGDYSASVDILNVKTGKLRTASLALARQYFAVAAAGGKAFFAGGFANDPPSPQQEPDAGYRSSIVDVYDSATGRWSVMHLSTNRSNLMGTSVMDRFVLFAGGTRQLPTADLCGAMERSAVIDIYDTQTDTWSTSCLSKGRTALDAASVGNTAIFFGGPGDPVELLSFNE